MGDDVVWGPTKITGMGNGKGKSKICIQFVKKFRLGFAWGGLGWVEGRKLSEQSREQQQQQP